MQQVFNTPNEQEIYTEITAMSLSRAEERVELIREGCESFAARLSDKKAAKARPLYDAMMRELEVADIALNDVRERFSAFANSKWSA